MPNTHEKKMVEQGYKYLDGNIHAMAKFFQKRIENLEKLIPSSVPIRKKKNFDAKYKKANLKQITNELKYSNSDDQALI